MRRQVVASLTVALICLGAGQLQAQQKDQGNRERPHLGITVAPSNNTETEGVLVQQILPNSPAAKAGLKKGDIITRVDGRNIADADDLVNILAHHKPGDQLRFQVARNDQNRHLTVTLSEQAARSEEKAEEPAGNATAEEHMPFLGVHAIAADELPQRLRNRMGIAGEEGLVVLEVVPNSPAAKAGLKHGDVILNMNNNEITSEHDLRKQIRNAQIGSTVRMNIQRGDEKKQISAKLAEAPWQFSMGHDLREHHGRLGRLFGRSAYNADEERQIERLERQVQRLEQRLQELEERSGQKSKESK